MGSSSPRALRPRSRTLSNAERVVAWPGEDGVRDVVSGGDGGVVWWRFGGGISVVEFWWWAKITIAKEKRLPEDHSPYKSHIFPLYNGIGLTTHKLTEISHLGTSMM